ncbi:hypothetical protein JDV02_008743 [Purpureocillium takamizusanense]|uniref:Major facilitator superfamily (MFS) profile domain-containing protein n=1 Tax=Purpureocillium takamizusanense TaxID=2060973 RepID=A0A9Q8QKT3_9HYPO|nr:uncharacterized protein JDV02_008743 [Purpureocillium takamizusanense]UNI22899.1 hypothetical protein JDV02_008743 [Purpureocillium takamizusanense]
MTDYPLDATMTGEQSLPREDETNKTTATAVAVVETDPNKDLTLLQSIKKWPRVVLYCVGLTFAILMYGYDYAIVGTTSAMPSFQRDFGEQLPDGKWILPSLWLGLWTFASPGASIIGAIAGGWFQDWRGRRASLALGSLLCAVGVAISFVSSHPADINGRRGVFLAGKGFQGGAIGMVMTTTQTYMSEIAPPSLRGPLLALFPVFTLLGQLIGAAVIFGCLNLPNGYTICFGTQWVFSAIPLLLSYAIPESPTYLVRRGLLDEARRAQRRLDGHDDVPTEETIAAIRRNIEEERKSARATYRDCFKGANRRRTVIVMFAGVLPQMFGLTLLSKASYFVQVLGMSSTLSVLVLILGIVCGVLANVCSIYIMSRVGRRNLTMYSLAILTILWGAMGVAGIWPGTISMWYSAATMILAITVAGLSVWPASYAVGAEASSLQLRARAQGVGWLTAGVAAAIFGFALPYIYNPDQGDLKAKTAFVFAGLCAVSFVASFWLIPEMKGRTPSEIDRMFEQKLPSRKFSSWRGDESMDGAVIKLDSRTV